MKKIRNEIILGVSLVVISTVVVWSRFNGSAKSQQGSPRPNNGRPSLILLGFKNRISDVAFHPNNKLLATSDSGAKITLWDLRSGKPHRVFEKSDFDGLIAFSANGQFLMSGRQKVWDAKTGKLLRSFLGGHKGHAILESQFYENGKMVPSTTKVPAGITDFIVSPDGQFLATSSNDRTTEIWDAQKGKLRWTLKSHTASVESIAFSPDSNLLASGSLDTTIKVWDVRTGKLKRTLTGHTDTPRAVSFVSNGKTLASVGQGGEIFVWDVATGKLKQKHQGENIIPYAAFSANGRRLAASITQYGLSNEIWGDIWIHDSLTGKVLYKLKTAAPDSFALSSDGKMLAIGGVEYNPKYRNGYRIVAQVWRIP